MKEHQQTQIQSMKVKRRWPFCPLYIVKQPPKWTAKQAQRWKWVATTRPNSPTSIWIHSMTHSIDSLWKAQWNLHQKKKEMKRWSSKLLSRLMISSRFRLLIFNNINLQSDILYIQILTARRKISITEAAGQMLVAEAIRLRLNQSRPRQWWMWSLNKRRYGATPHQMSICNYMLRILWSRFPWSPWKPWPKWSQER